MAVNKVETRNGNEVTVLMDLTSDTVTPEGLLEGLTAHGADGKAITGTLGTATEEKAGLVKLYGEEGDNEDGSMTQKAITEALDGCVKTDDSRLSDARTPKAHTHPTSDITGFDFSEAMMNRGVIGDTTDWNTITASGCYMVSLLGDAETYHSPLEYGSIYNYGLLFVIKSTDLWIGSSLTQGRVLQIYFPHRQDENTDPVLMRMYNRSIWHKWHRLSYNTWRGIQNNLTSDSTDDSLSAAQGKALKALIDGKADKTKLAEANAKIDELTECILEMSEIIYA